LGQAEDLFDNWRYDEALELVEGHLAEHPEDALAWHRRAENLLGLEREDDAAEAAGRSIELDPSISAAYRLRAVVHQNNHEVSGDAGRR
jgi:tetratricopeptide (TPR) repeat protein